MLVITDCTAVTYNQIHTYIILRLIPNVLNFLNKEIFLELTFV